MKPRMMRRSHSTHSHSPSLVSRASLLQMTLPHVEHRTVHASHMCLPHCEQVLQHQHWFPPWMPTWQYVPYHASSSSAS